LGKPAAVQAFRRVDRVIVKGVTHVMEMTVRKKPKGDRGREGGPVKTLSTGGLIRTLNPALKNGIRDQRGKGSWGTT